MNADPKNQGLYVYIYTTGAGATTNVCPNGSGSNTLSGNTNFSVAAFLENTSDPAGQASFDYCTGSPGVPATYTSGRYFVCND